MLEKKICSVQTLKRLPYYLNYCRSIEDKHVSSAQVARALHLSEIQVRKDLACISQSGGKPRLGFDTKELIHDIEHFLGYDNLDDAIIVGVGHLGKAIMNFKGLYDYGIKIVMGFDHNIPEDEAVGGVPVFPIERLADLTQRLHIRLGIITVPKDSAKEVFDLMVASGIKAVLNFAPIMLKGPDHVKVINENMASSMAQLTQFLKEDQ